MSPSSLPAILRAIFRIVFLLAGLAEPIFAASDAMPSPDSTRVEMQLSGAWQFTGAGLSASLPDIGTPTFDQAKWDDVKVPHVFQTRSNRNGIMKGWYRREITVPAAMSGKRLYLVFEGAAAIADVYANGKLLGRHRGAYTRFVFDATEALHQGVNSLAVKVDVSPSAMQDCLPNATRLYTVWGGLYRKVWLLAVGPLHIDPTDDASPGVYITPTHVSESGADLNVRVLVRNTTPKLQNAMVRAVLLDPDGHPVSTMRVAATVAPGQRTEIEMKDHLPRPKLWTPGTPNLYHVRVGIERDGRIVDTVTEPTGFRDISWKDGRFFLNGKSIILAGGNLHQEIESKASAMDDEDFQFNYSLLKDMGANFVRLPHYPHAKVEYDLCDRIGLFCWAENGHSNKEVPSPTAERITRELVKQNYNHPSIAVWSVGNEASADTAEAMVPVVKALDATRSVAVANMTCKNADFHGANTYNGWYGKDRDCWKFQNHGYVTETGAGGVVTIHCDYAAADFKVNHYEPEEYQQIFAESRCQMALKENNGALGLFAWWAFRDLTDTKYKGPNGWNTKGILTYAGDKKDIYYLFRSFLRPEVPTVHITSKRYFLRDGAPDNGIKVYSNAKELTLVLNGQTVSTLENGKYTHANGRVVNNVFYWPVPLHTGKNIVMASDKSSHTDSAVIYYNGTGGLPEVQGQKPLVTNLTTTNPNNTAYYMDMPVHPQWPIYYDLDSTADNSTDALPDVLEGATWLALRRVTKPGLATEVGFTLARPATVYVMVSAQADTPDDLAKANFRPVSVGNLNWRDNNLLLVPARLYALKATAGTHINLPLGERDALVMFKDH